MLILCFVCELLFMLTKSLQIQYMVSGNQYIATTMQVLASFLFIIATAIGMKAVTDAMENITIESIFIILGYSLAGGIGVLFSMKIKYGRLSRQGG